jgi:hypothetical protein
MDQVTTFENDDVKGILPLKGLLPIKEPCRFFNNEIAPQSFRFIANFISFIETISPEPWSRIVLI